eukprot:CAMPEP_0175586534 /NCGR_PEP_ID=MMETSP0096-20121207/50285_1 /TAXON_ID=311494 /ORGANISM="Alexandrium monilatum, Strain CCMP3105" /LENGTH=68 /DNA_ID=CAMNT_0016890407 /DNA_START=27 /DNA_END=230 /DNA_ORIENTATION=-
MQMVGKGPKSTSGGKSRFRRAAHGASTTTNGISASGGAAARGAVSTASSGGSGVLVWRKRVDKPAPAA